jgi:eukaryotic-like serine/threonine-protein kinase
MIGKALGPYRVLDKLGEGGMGEVYRAQDTRLHREVAIKVLPALMATDPDRVGRFEQEARATAALNHPNIVALYDIGNERGTAYVVSELLTGGTLRERIAAGPMPVRKVVEIGLGVLNGLAAAHERGIAHRDVKPENIFLTADGMVKILDFGLAKLSHSVALDAGQSVATVTGPGTTPGLVLGTIGYMAPEQVRGLPADHRSDIFAFGAVLFEMLTGRRAFHGPTTADTMTAILTSDPLDLASAPAGVPAAVNAVVRRCLEKDPRERFQSARDLSFALQAMATETRSGVTAVTTPARSRLVPAVAAVLAVCTVAAVGLVMWGRPQPASNPATRVAASITAPPDVRVEGTPAIAPDGRTVAFVGSGGGATARIFVRSLDTFEARAIAGTEGAEGPFWSPDSRSLGFFARGRLWRVDVAGNVPRSIAAVSDPRGGAWGRDNTIVYSPQPDGGLYRILADGGTPSELTTLDRARQEISHRWPRLLPDGRHVLFMNRIATPQLARYTITAVSTSGGDRKPLLDAMSPGVYDSGRLLFTRDDKLFAQPFDPAAVTLSGGPELVTDEVWTDGQGMAGLVGFDATGGVLGWRPALSRRMHMAWRNRDGNVLQQIQARDAALGVPSNDGRLIMVVIPDSQMNTVRFAILDPARGTFTPFTAPDTTSTSTVWSPDSRRVVYSLLRDGAYDLYIKEVRPGGTEQRLLHTDGMKAAKSWSPDGKVILFNATDPQTRLDLWAIEATPGATPKVFAGGEADQCCGKFSPDGRWVAYVSNDSGQPEVFVKPSGREAEPVRISKDGGGGPEWHTGGRELYFLNPENRLMGATVTVSGDTFTAGTPVPLFAINSWLKPAVQLRVSDDSPYAVVGDRFLVTENEPDPRASTIQVLVNWTAPRR